MQRNKSYLLLEKGGGVVWKDAVEKRYFWASIEHELEKILYELMKAEEEEDSGIYLLMMHYEHAEKEVPFSYEERKKILGHLKTLIEDSRKHRRLLQEIIDRLRERTRSETRK